jgi:hypothetical protein
VAGSDEHVEDLLKMMGPTAGMAVLHAGEISELKSNMARLEQMFVGHGEHITESCKRIEETLVSIDKQVKLTNGRVGELEKDKAIAAALREAAAEAVEDRRKTMALSLARHGWIRPLVAGGGMSILVAVVTKLLL